MNEEPTVSDEAFLADEAFLDDLQAFMAASVPERLPLEHEIALKQQAHERLKPEEVRAPEVAVLTLIALAVMGLGGVQVWTLTNLLIIGPALVIYLTATLMLGAEKPDFES